MSEGTIIDLKKGEAIAALHIIRELSKHRSPPITVLGSQLEERPTINVTLKQSISEEENVSQEYKTGRYITIRDRRNHETEHFTFEWIAPQ